MRVFAFPGENVSLIFHNHNLKFGNRLNVNTDVRKVRKFHT